MKLLSKVSVLLLVGAWCASACADWRYLGGQRYSDGQYVWRAYQYCGKWYHQKLYPVVQAKDFWDNALAGEIQGEIEAGRRSYLEKRFPIAAAQNFASYGNASSGYSVLQQGYAPGLVTGGQTLYGVSQHLGQLQQIDVNGMIHEAQRLADRTTNLNQVAISGAGQLVSQAVEGNTKAAQIFASAQVAAAAIQAANPPQQQTTVFENHPEYPSGPRVQGAPSDSRSPPPQDVPPQPQYNDQSNLTPHDAGTFALNVCAKCHSGPTPKAGLHLTGAALAQLSPDELADLGERIEKRINLPVNDPKHMPPKKELPAKWKSGLVGMLVQR